jgi:hypothetical protein
MKSFLSVILLAAILPMAACSQIDLNKIGKQAQSTINKNKPLTNGEVVQGLKEALNVGSNNAAASASQMNGYFGNPIIKILFPPEAKDMEAKLRAIGMGKQVDEFILTMNRAAEEAAKEAGPVFLSAIKNMSIGDGFAILRGNDTAATSYLRKNTTFELHDKFKPIIKTATQKVDVTRYWTPLASAYNKIPFVTKVNPDLDEYITGQGLNGLFYLVSQEEIKIRKDPVARVTDILKRVFGSK